MAEPGEPTPEFLARQVYCLSVSSSAEQLCTVAAVRLFCSVDSAARRAIWPVPPALAPDWPPKTNRAALKRTYPRPRTCNEPNLLAPACSPRFEPRTPFEPNCRRSRAPAYRDGPAPGAADRPRETRRAAPPRCGREYGGECQAGTGGADPTAACRFRGTTTGCDAQVVGGHRNELAETPQPAAGTGTPGHPSLGAGVRPWSWAPVPSRR
jgi:hypothetical protein